MLEFCRWPVRRYDDLPAGVAKCIDGKAKFGLSRSAQKKLQVVDEQNIDIPQHFLKGGNGPHPECSVKTMHKLFGGKVERLPLRVHACPGDGLKQVSLTQPNPGVDEERVEHDPLALLVCRNLLGRGICEHV